MISRSQLDMPTTTQTPLPGLEADNLLGILAALGLLRALETSRPEWGPRLSWVGPPWVAELHTWEPIEREAVAAACMDGLASWGPHVGCGDMKDVKLDVSAFRAIATDARATEHAARFAAALTAECPAKQDGSVYPSQLVFMFGQGHQHFLERVVAAVRNVLPAKLRKSKAADDLVAAGKIAEALFQPWRRSDPTDSFRWDPADDQRYALRFSDPSGEGAALTVHGANRLAALGFLSFACFPGQRRMNSRGVVRDSGSEFVWPLATSPASLASYEALLAHPDVLAGNVENLRRLGVGEVMRARRVSNGKFVNVSLGRPSGRATVEAPTRKAVRRL